MARDTAIAAAFTRLDNLEVRLCLPVNAIARFRAVRHYFAVVSRLGDGVAWYVLLALIALVAGVDGVLASVHMGLTSLVGVALYRGLKARLVRERPFHSHRGVRALVNPLDRYSFPSGHTLHAASFSVMLWHYTPPLGWPGLMVFVWPFALSVAVSRVVLGLHYPSDVLAGALIGVSLAQFSLMLFG